MASKITVIALVLIIAVPILIGYGLNFTTETETVYDPVGDQTNVTQLLTNSVDYTYVSANTLSLNSDNLNIDLRNVNENIWRVGDPQIPLYQSYTTSYSGLYYYNGIYDNSMPSTVTLSGIEEMWFSVDYHNTPLTASTGVNLTLTKSGGTTTPINKILAFHYEHSSASNSGNPRLYYTYLDTPHTRTSALNMTDYVSISFTSGADYDGSIYMEWRNLTDTAQSISSAGKYIDISGGFRLIHAIHRFAPGAEGNSPTILRPVLSPPTSAGRILLTVDLDSISDSDYTWYIEPSDTKDTTTFPMAGERIELQKTTTGGESVWTFARYEAGYGSPTYTAELPQNPAGNNVYQLEITPAKATLYYVGAWPNMMGYANSFRSWKTEMTIGGDIAKLAFTAHNSTLYKESPIMRVDFALIHANEKGITQDLTYTPSNIKPLNPSTTLNNIAKFGSSIDFGGNNYPVQNGNITLGTHSVAVDGMTFSTYQTALGVFENRINGNLVSTTATPSTITFNGSWAFNVTTESMESSVEEVTAWQPGGFAWDGVGFDFYLVGLLTSVAVFIGLAMYGRRSGAKVGGLMLICGGAAFMFLLLM